MVPPDVAEVEVFENVAKATRTETRAVSSEPDLAIDDAQFMVLVGTVGAGTTMALRTGRWPQGSARGVVRIGERSSTVSRRGTGAPRRPPELCAGPAPSATDKIAPPACRKKVPKDEVAARARDARAPGLDDFLDRK